MGSLVGRRVRTAFGVALVAGSLGGVLVVSPGIAGATPTTVSTWAGLVAAIPASGSVTVQLTATITATSGDDLVVPSPSTVTLDLNGHGLTITSPAADDAAVEVEGALTVQTTGDGKGTLTATGGTGGAGIGGGDTQSGGTTTITGGTVHAKGGTGAAGIGSGSDGGTTISLSYHVAGKVTISGGTVHATGGEYGAGIGAGDDVDGTIAGIAEVSAGTIAISDGDVTATGGYSGAGVGGGAAGYGGTITISGGTLSATGGEYAAGVGGGTVGSGGTISITGGTLTAASAAYGAGIGGGATGPGGKIAITAGTVTATGGSKGAGIGGGSQGPGGTTTIKGGTVHATGGTHGAGIGGGTYGTVEGAEASGGTVTISGTANVTATGGAGGAGIGDGYKGIGGTVTIDGGAVHAKGGASDAGIGGGTSGGGVSVTISNGAVVVAAGGTAASSVGGASDSKASFGSLTNSGQLLLKGPEEDIPSEAAATNTTTGLITLETTLTGGGTLVNTGTMVVGTAGSVTSDVTVTEHDYVVTYTANEVEPNPSPETLYASNFLVGEVSFPTPPANYEWASAESGGTQVTASTDLTTPALFGESPAGATDVTLYLVTVAPSTVTLYVRTGSGGTTCATTASGPTPGDACGQIQTAVERAETYGSSTPVTAVTITVGPNTGGATYAGGVAVTASGLRSLTVVGKTGAPATTVSGGKSEQDVALSGGTVTITGLSIETGSATTGGGLFVGSGVAATLTGDVFSHDSASSSGGGLGNLGTVTITGTTFTGDGAPLGGAISNTATYTSVTMVDDTFTGDSATDGGGIGLTGGSFGVSGGSFSDDTARGDGGGIYIDGPATFTDGTLVFSGDRATLGGGFYNDGYATFNDTVFTRDVATDGAGIYNVSAMGLNADTLSFDSATQSGGGVYNAGGATLTDDTLAGDSARSGGALYNSGLANLSDDTFFRDRARAGGGVDDVGGGGTLDASILDASSCAVSGGGTLTGSYDVTTRTTGCAFSSSVQTTTRAIDLVPRLETTATYTTVPPTLALGPTSPAVDEVPSSACTIKTDERGAPRPGDTTPTGRQTSCDAGSYELQHEITTLVQATPTSGTVSHGRPGFFQLRVTSAPRTTGRVSFALTSAPVSGVTVSPSGRISVSPSTPVGTYTLSGTDTDPLHDSGGWTFTLEVTGVAARIVSPSTAFFSAGRFGSFGVAATGTAPITLTESGTLPKGLTFRTLGPPGLGSAAIDGTPAPGSEGTYHVEVTATNDLGTDIQDVTVIVR